MSRMFFLTLIGFGCSEYNFGKATDEEDEEAEEGAESVDADSPPVVDTGLPPTTDTSDPPADTGTPFDPPVDQPELDSCPPLETPGTIGIDESCVADPETGTLGAWMEWEITAFDEYPEYDEMVTTPIVGQLTDDNGDGLIDENDIPDIIATFDDDAGAEDKFGVLRRISGDGRSSEVLITSWNDGSDDWGPYRYATSALGDVDNDGETEIVVVIAGPPAIPSMGPPPDGPSIIEDGPEDHPIGPPPPPSFLDEPDISCYPAAFSTDGVLEWIYEGSFIDCGGHGVALADLEGDGTVEVVLGKVIVNGEDGSLQAEGWGGDASYGGSYFEMGKIPSIADLDGDGDQEVLAGYSIYNANGSEHCNLWNPSDDGFTAVADLDLDGDGEIVMVWDHKIAVIDHNCNKILEWRMIGDGTGGPPTIADFDGDGMPEIGVASASHYCVYESDGVGVLNWSFESTDASSHATGSTVFDFEGDGRPEVIYGDEVRLWVLDGLTGAVRWEDSRHSSRTLHEYPIVVDVDGDDYPEIVVPNGGGHYSDPKTGLFVLGSDVPGGRGWLGGRQVWNQHAYNIVNVNDDLSIPSVPESNWPFHNNFRSGDLNPVYADNAPDAVPLVESCPWDCDEGVLRLQVRLANKGTATLRSDLKLTIYDIATDEPIVTENISPPIAPGLASAPFEYAFDASTVGTEGLYVVVDDAGGVESIRECDESNNEVWLPEATCW